MRVLFRNIAGMSKLDEEAWEFLRKHDIIGLTETWIKEKDIEKVKNRLKEFDISCFPARKKKGRGRPKGGVILAYKKYIGKLKDEERQNEETIIEKMCLDNKILTVGVTYMREHRTENWGLIKEVVEDPEERIMIGGDFNARTADRAGD